jgi:Concanavalin A-like lectin/glucanases superfamily/Divergent InlB B-repeat domain/Fn3 associated/Immunoglobulin domain
MKANCRVFIPELLARSSTLIALVSLTFFLNSGDLHAQACVTAPSGIVSWWSGESNAMENVSGNNGILVNGASFGPGKVGSAFYLSGANQCVRVPDAQNLRFTNAMTAEAWVFLTRTPPSSTFSVFVKYDAVPGVNQSAFGFSIDPSSHPYFLLSTNGAPPASVSITASGTTPTNVWTHIAATYDGSQVSIYINGTLDSSMPFTGSIFPGTDDLGIGANVGGEPAGGMTAPFAGYIDEPAVYNRALSAAEIRAIYNAGSAGKCPVPVSIVSQPTNQTVQERATATFNVGAAGSQPLSYQWSFGGTNIAAATQSVLTLYDVQLNQAGNYSVVVSNAVGFLASSNATLTVTPGPPCLNAPSNLVSAWSAEGNAWDNVGGNNGILVNGASFVFPGMVGSAFNLNGANQCVRVPDARNLHFTNAMTAEAWVYLTKPPGQFYSILLKYDAIVGFNQRSYALSINSTGNPYLIISTNGIGDTVAVTATNKIVTNVWTHVAGTFDGSQMRVYINGALDTSIAFSGSIFPGTNDLGIGANVGGESPGGMINPFPGYIDEPALYSRALSAAEILAIYNAGNAGKCFPSSSPQIYAQPPNITTLPGANISLVPFATGSPNLIYQWAFNGTNLPNATNRTLTLTNVQLSNAGDYVLSVSNSLGSIPSSNAVVTVEFVTTFGNGTLLTNSQYTYPSPVSIQLKNYYTNGYVFYTLDGTTPSPNSTEYTGPFVLSSNATITALGYTPDFQESVVSPPIQIVVLPNFTLATTTAGGGSIVRNPTNSTYVINSMVTVTAKPSNGWTFLEWQGDIAGINPTNTVLMSKNKSVQAVFGTPVGTSASAGGSVVLNPLGGIYPFGTVLQASAIPQSGEQFLFWGDSVSGSTNPLLYSVTTTNATIAALFGSLGNGQVALAAVPLGHGTLSVNPAANSYTTGQSVTITATPNAGATFQGWSGSASGTNNPLTVVMNQSKTIYANFSTNFNLTFREGPGKGLSEGAELDLQGELGSHYRLDASTDLVTWTPLFNLTNDVGTLHYIDTNAETLSLRFYRAVILP